MHESHEQNSARKTCVSVGQSHQRGVRAVRPVDQRGHELARCKLALNFKKYELISSTDLESFDPPTQAIRRDSSFSCPHTTKRC